MNRLKYLLIILILSSMCSAGVRPPVSVHSRHSGDLVSTLEFIAVQYSVPILAEVTIDYPVLVTIEEGNEDYAAVLNRLTTQFQDYQWSDLGGVIVFTDKTLREAPGNFFNFSISRFVMPANVAELKLQLNQLMKTRNKGAAPVMAGVPDMPLETVKLRKGEVLTNTNGRQILIAAARESRDIFSVALFPTRIPRTKSDEDRAHMNWFVRSIKELPTNPTRARSVRVRP